MRRGRLPARAEAVPLALLKDSWYDLSVGSLTGGKAMRNCWHRLASGKVVWVDGRGVALKEPPHGAEFAPVDDGEYDEGPTCSICDGVGHGYPGGPPCPLETRGAAEAEFQ